MKQSYYNFFFPYEYEDGKMIAYNSLSNSMALIDEDKYKMLLDFSETGKAIDDDNLVESLKKGNFIIDDDTDELQIIRHNMYASRFNTNSLGLTIAVTSDCNFRCIYCYEKNAINSCYMNEDTEKSIIEMVEKQAKTIGYFSVTWYGGEPLLNMGTIERLSEKFIEICEKYEIKYYAGIVTNGYNLTKKNWDILKKYKVSHMQITVDGDEETHNKRRPLQNGQATFAKIIDNLVALKDELIPVSLRINTDRENYMNVESVLKILQQKELTKVVFPYIAKVDSNNDCYDDKTCLTMPEYLENRFEFSELMSKYGYDVTSSWKSNYPTRKNSFCTCDKINTFVIGADGEMYKCWDDIGKKEISIGNINKFKTNMNKVYLYYMMFDPLTNDKCNKCKYIPVCMGGCPNRRINNPQLVCDETKHNFEQKLKNIALQIKQSKEENAQVCH